jgi:hypothetical protein
VDGWGEIAISTSSAHHLATVNSVRYRNFAISCTAPQSLLLRRVFIYKKEQEQKRTMKCAYRRAVTGCSLLVTGSTFGAFLVRSQLDVVTSN